ncbi:MAG TPA: response regulator transcription factor [Jatrophihabitantaceae bacterium]|nr:response regulator transcription factor [Jatrophihabitantaceae bacterium]
MSIRVVLADDQAVVRDGLALLLRASADIELLAAAADGQQAVEYCVELRPDVALLDLRMPKLDGAQVTAALATQAPEVRVLILTTFADDDAVLPALRAGAVGYLTKDTTGEALVAAIADVAAGRTVLDPAVQRRLVELATAGGTPSTERAPSAPVPSAPAPSAMHAAPGASTEAEAAGLTRREVDVVRLVAEGLTNRQIARRLVVSEATVKTHLNHVLSKLDVDGRPALVAWAWRQGLGGSSS